MKTFPEQGDYIAVDFSPARGHEQQGFRPALVVSEAKMNRFGMAWLLPITSNIKGYGKIILPKDEPLHGAIMFTQIKTLDLTERAFLSKGRASDEVLSEALGKIAAVLGID